MVLISYDFDFRTIKYFDEGLNSYPNGRFNTSDKLLFPTDSLESIDFVDSTIALGVGQDSISIVDSNTKLSFVIEPCSSLLFAFKIHDCLRFFKENAKAEKKVEGAGIVLFDNLFRLDGDRGIHELDIAIDFYHSKYWNISFRKNGSDYVFSIELDDFTEAYVCFLRKTIAFYSYLIEGFSGTVLGKELINLIIKYNDAFEEREEEGGKTFYDFM